ncbi:SpoIIE family protein phosphatase [Streptomyces sp. NPDC090106]|uniref:SpoIIE family protein phosphatase n=1 Tax=Streptomyces sp. NPDC090106 TaxID=3365946 RepID=UPI003804E89A
MLTSVIGGPHRRCAVGAEEDVGALRRAVSRIADGQPGLRPGAGELVATELGTNLLRHAHPGGWVLVRRCGDGIELISVDQGPGLAPGALAPGAGTAVLPVRGGGLSAGLNVVRRYAAEFDCYSTRGGTVVYARLGTVDPGTAGRWRFGGVEVPRGGEGESGDAWAVAPDVAAEGLAAVVVDGLGHGPAAAVAAGAAIGAFAQDPAGELDALFRRSHEAMRVTRGGVLGACRIDPAGGTLTYSGVGNITGRVLSGARSVHLLDRPGTLGTQLAQPAVRPQTCAWESGATLVLATDGIRSGWNLDAHPRLLGHHPAVVAAVLHRDHGRLTDDATVLVVRDGSGAA